ncbi:ribonuclease H2, subunit B [Scheffersomyces xylosifermentans]|uniref:ribonuclease H2, subunit B n=1 Tax=Scheffersomyces xylosifermentans TaxID=1304137 RepID=UPI00315CBB54
MTNSLYVDANSRVILLPKSSETSSYQLVDIPIPRDLSRTKPYLVNEGNDQKTSIYDLSEVKNDNPYTVQDNVPVLKNGDPVKSFIFEASGEEGAVIQSGKVLVANKFDITWLLISIFYSKDQFTKNFITVEDVMDKLAAIFSQNDKWVHTLSDQCYSESLVKICESIVENREMFYKFSIEKTFEFVKNKVELLREFIAKGENSIITNIKGKLTDKTAAIQDIPETILALMILRYSVDFVCDSYVGSKFKKEFLTYTKYDFTELDNYLTELQDKQKNLQVVEANMNAVAQSSAQTSSKKKKEDSKKKTTLKKVVKKVAVGKGALDGFFKKA